MHTESSAGGPPSDIVIEPLTTAADLELVAALEARCFTNPWSREMLARELARSDTTRVFVLRLPESPVAAFCACWFIVDELHVNTLVVDFPYRRQGLARLLMRYIASEAVRSGVTRGTLEVRESNVAARKLYESLGFAIAARRPKYYEHPVEDALILWHEDLAKLGHPEC